MLTVSFFLMSTHNHNDVIDLRLLGYNQHVSSIPLRRRAEELAPASEGRDPRDYSIRSRRPGHAGRRAPTPPSSLIGTAVYGRMTTPATAATSAAQGMLRSKPAGIVLGTRRSQDCTSGASTCCRTDRLLRRAQRVAPS